MISAPSLSVYTGAEPAGYPEAQGGACVVHKLLYDRDGKYVGERQYAEC